MKYYAIIVGGGSGSRMESDIPKQFLLLNGRPLLMHTIEAFHNSTLHPEIILVLNVDFHNYWEDLCKQFKFEIPFTLVKGGSQRFFSVKNGLKSIKGKAIVAIHDAVRPIISDKLITEIFNSAESNGSAIPAVVCKETVRQKTGEISIPLNRNEIYLVQTPQAFDSKLLNKAYRQTYRNEFTDDASVVEKSGTTVNMISGDYKNIKITFPEDLILAEAYLENI